MGEKKRKPQITIEKDVSKKKQGIQPQISIRPTKSIRIERMFSDSDLLCQDLSDEQCDELRSIKFTDKPAHLILPVQSLEERYNHEIRDAKLVWDKKIKAAQQKNLNRYKLALESKKKEIQYNIKLVITKIEENLEKLEAQERMILSQIDVIYGMNKEKLVDECLKIIDFDFIN